MITTIVKFMRFSIKMFVNKFNVLNASDISDNNHKINK